MGPTDRPPPTTGFLLWHVSLRWRVAVDRALAPLDLTHATYGLLATLHGLSRDGLEPSQRELADYSGLEPMYISKLARSLQRSGLLERAESQTDPRAWRLTLTNRGNRVLRKAVATVQALHDRLLAPLGGTKSTRSLELKDALWVLLKSFESHPRTKVRPALRQAAGRGRK
jgi:DNA-binding MarR family transcriptional regulator